MWELDGSFYLLKDVLSQNTIIIINLLQSTAVHRSATCRTTEPSLRFSPSSCYQPLCANHRVLTEVALFRPRRSFHSRTSFLQWLSVLWQAWPAHCHFSQLANLLCVWLCWKIYILCKKYSGQDSKHDFIKIDQTSQKRKQNNFVLKVTTWKKTISEHSWMLWRSKVDKE